MLQQPDSEGLPLTCMISGLCAGEMSRWVVYESLVQEAAAMEQHQSGPRGYMVEGAMMSRVLIGHGLPHTT